MSQPSRPVEYRRATGVKVERGERELIRDVKALSWETREEMGFQELSDLVITSIEAVVQKWATKYNMQFEKTMTGYAREFRHVSALILDWRLGERRFRVEVLRGRDGNKLWADVVDAHFYTPREQQNMQSREETRGGDVTRVTR